MFKLILKSLLLLVIVTPSIHAQQPGAEITEGATDNASPDQLHVTASEHEETSPRRHQFQRALPHLKKAEALFANDIFEPALAEFKKAYEILEGHPKHYQILYNIGLCYERLARYIEALAYYQQYLQACGVEGKDCAIVKKDIETLKGVLATLLISVNVEAEVWTDGVLMGTAPGTVMVAGGRHTVELRAKGYESEQLEVRIPAGTIGELKYEMEKRGIGSTFFWASTILAVTSIGIGTCYGIDAVIKHDEAKESDGHLNSEKTPKQIDDQVLKADIFLGIGGVFAITSGILYFLTDWHAEGTPHSYSQSKSPVKLSTYWGRSKTHVVLNGRF